VGVVSGLNERVEVAYEAKRGVAASPMLRLAVSAALVIGSGTIAGWFGLVALIASGYSAFGYIMLAIYVLPLLTIGIYKIRQHKELPNKRAGAATE
jgi:uncharacterized membrane protein YkvI